MKYIKMKDFDYDIKPLKGFDKRKLKLGLFIKPISIFYILLKYICFFFEYYADIYVKKSWYNTKVIVNKGNWLFIKIDFTRAKEIYLEAISIQTDRVQEIYNLGLDIVRLYLPEESIQAFDKLLTVVMNYIFVIYQLANLYEQHNELNLATKLLLFLLLTFQQILV